MNVVEKILARKSGKPAVAPDDVVITGVDLMVMHDLSANFVMKVFENEMGGAVVAYHDKLIFAFDHKFSPATPSIVVAAAFITSSWRPGSLRRAWSSSVATRTRRCTAR